MRTAIIVIGMVTGIEIWLLLFLLWRIARFYERSSGRRVFSFLFLPSMLFLAGGGVYYLIADSGFVGNSLADFILFLGGALLVIATTLMEQIMMGGK